MNTNAFIKMSLEQSKQWLMGLLSDVIKDAPTARPTAQGGNHPLWILGHTVTSEAGIVYGFILGQESPLSKWDSCFGKSNIPVADANAYPPVDELLAAYETVRTNTLQVLESMTEADFEKPSHVPAELKPIFGTIGQCFMMVCLHPAFHAGQVADVRRALGRKPLFA